MLATGGRESKGNMGLVRVEGLGECARKLRRARARTAFSVDPVHVGLCFEAHPGIARVRIFLGETKRVHHGAR